MVDCADNVDKDPASATLVFWTYLPDVKDIIVLAAFENTDGVAEAPAFDKFSPPPNVSRQACVLQTSRT